MLRSSPTLEGRCCPFTTRFGVAPCRSCDPHRPWRAGAATCTSPPRGSCASSLRSSPTLEGRCCLLRLADRYRRGLAVAILTDPGGPVLHGQERVTAMGGVEVAILTDPGGPVLP